ncbi:BTB/POZ domain-containing protein 9-like isoform X2 [Adelges cooleyi]|uniref:BTB/POZ domain-containing protein 9-like isoform X2 n=1 Tax=Adelges cooleyi TaxID=133065 RepID=UPI00217FFD4A|nr:BTB/POZ domain-containing protein 9-like isoform X2 [Adelges cooleyi]
MMFIYIFVIIIITSNAACSDSYKRNFRYTSSEEQIDHSPSFFSEINSLYLQDSALFYNEGLMKPFQTDVTLGLDGTSVSSFKVLLKCIYTGQLNLSILEDNVIIELFRLSNLFKVPKVLLAVSKHLGSKIDEQNVFTIFGLARHYQHNELIAESLNFMDSHALLVLQSQDFLSLPPEAIQEILIRDTFVAYELDVFRAVCFWIKTRKDKGDPEATIEVLSNVRDSLIRDDKLSSVIKESQLDKTEIVEAIRLGNLLSPSKRQTPRHSNPNINMASSSHGTQVKRRTDGNNLGREL